MDDAKWRLETLASSAKGNLLITRHRVKHGMASALVKLSVRLFSTEVAGGVGAVRTHLRVKLFKNKDLFVLGTIRRASALRVKRDT